VQEEEQGNKDEDQKKRQPHARAGPVRHHRDTPSSGGLPSSRQGQPIPEMEELFSATSASPATYETDAGERAGSLLLLLLLIK